MCVCVYIAKLCVANKCRFKFVLYGAWGELWARDEKYSPTTNVVCHVRRPSAGGFARYIENREHTAIKSRESLFGLVKK